ncbi:MAG TPA: hypothetical protein VLE73_02835 [Candidatus Saccharimonadales bacterium]|nr:hypothetical protein [Candidatus Saccharimonadales bacterium]
MTERLDAAHQDWQWHDLNPLTRIIVAAFAGRIGDESQGDISNQAFIDAAADVLGSESRESILKTGGWSGLTGLRNLLINRLSTLETEPLTRMAQDLGRLAGNTEAIQSLAAQVAEQLSGADTQGAVPALRVLSELAIGLRATYRPDAG